MNSWDIIKPTGFGGVTTSLIRYNHRKDLAHKKKEIVAGTKAKKRILKKNINSPPGSYSYLGKKLYKGKIKEKPIKFKLEQRKGHKCTATPCMIPTHTCCCHYSSWDVHFHTLTLRHVWGLSIFREANDLLWALSLLSSPISSSVLMNRIIFFWLHCLYPPENLFCDGRQ